MPPQVTQTWVLKPENRVSVPSYDPGLPVVDAGNWREHDGIVHLLYEVEWESPWLRDPNSGEVEHVTVRNFITACGIRLEPLEKGDPGGPVYVEADLTCVVCCAAENDLT